MWIDFDIVDEEAAIVSFDAVMIEVGNRTDLTPMQARYVAHRWANGLNATFDWKGKYDEYTGKVPRKEAPKHIPTPPILTQGAKNMAEVLNLLDLQVSKQGEAAKELMKTLEAQEEAAKKAAEEKAKEESEEEAAKKAAEEKAEEEAEGSRG